MLRPGIVGMRKLMVIRLRPPCKTSSTRPPAPRSSLGALVPTVHVATAAEAVACRFAASLLPAPCQASAPVLDRSKPSSSADLLWCLAQPFGPDAELLEVLLEEPQSILLLSEGVAAVNPDHLPKHHPPRQALLSHACHETSEQYPSSAHRRFNALESLT